MNSPARHSLLAIAAAALVAVFAAPAAEAKVPRTFWGGDAGSLLPMTAPISRALRRAANRR